MIVTVGASLPSSGTNISVLRVPSDDGSRHEHDSSKRGKLVLDLDLTRVHLGCRAGFCHRSWHHHYPGHDNQLRLIDGGGAKEEAFRYGEVDRNASLISGGLSRPYQSTHPGGFGYGQPILSPVRSRCGQFRVTSQ